MEKESMFEINPLYLGLFAVVALLMLANLGGWLRGGGRR